MNLISHLVRKDIRGLGLPVGLWLLLICVTGGGFNVLSLRVDSVAGDEAAFWIRNVRTFAELIAIFIHIVGILLAAILMTEDPAVTTTGFWLTRPIAGGRMLMAKLLGAALLLVVAPTIVLVPVWLMSGFSANELKAAAVEFAGWRALLTVVAVAVAALAGSLARFLAAVLVVAAVTAVILIGSEATGVHRSGEILRSASFVAGWAALSGALFFLALQYQGPRRPAWFGFGAVYVTVMAVLSAWQWDITRPPNDDGLPKPQRLALIFNRSAASSREGTLVVSVEPAGDRDLVYAPESGIVRLRQANGEVSPHRVWPGMAWAEDAAKRIAGLNENRTSLSWRLFLSEGPQGRAVLAEERATLAGKLTMAAMRGRVLWELPLREGSEARVQSSWSRIVALGWTGETMEKRRVALEEREASQENRLPLRWPRERSGANYGADCFLLVHRATGAARLISLIQEGSADLHACRLLVRMLEFAPPPDVDPAIWEQEAVLIKVRFTREGTWDRAIAGPLLPPGSTEVTR